MDSPRRALGTQGGHREGPRGKERKLLQEQLQCSSMLHVPHPLQQQHSALIGFVSSFNIKDPYKIFFTKRIVYLKKKKKKVREPLGWGRDRSQDPSQPDENLGVLASQP